LIRDIQYGVMSFDNNVIKIHASGGVAVIPTDTIYGVVGSALDAEPAESTKQPKMVILV
jgi:tRNA A37 threonylcarbamoyladenosine synthetase subunit TsaC/SUA5/YrdC